MGWFVRRYAGARRLSRSIWSRGGLALALVGGVVPYRVTAQAAAPLVARTSAQASVVAGGTLVPPPSKAIEREVKLESYLKRAKAEQRVLVDQVQEGLLSPSEAREQFKAWRIRNPPPPGASARKARAHGPPPPVPPRKGTWKIS